MKTIEEIYQSLLTAYAQRTGTALAEDCDLAVRFYAAAAQLQALDIQAWWVLDQSFPQTDLSGRSCSDAGPQPPGRR